ncbi:hypothetical protein [Ktedonospora formicarum]|uniref:Uncharacterized protein n=1 Tax=Ktedonospora formicarum TaxID=2778364 RepID=A0A8J3IAM6_9CHLR|nr:hypothetical protein [Ktedonospora formicarum]GHO50363.1 hypothetical protein KSX_85260 [Ktedonospora formicarum]
MPYLRSLLKDMRTQISPLDYLFSVTIGWIWRTQIVLHPKRTIDTIHQTNPPKSLEMLSGSGYSGIFVTDGTNVCAHSGFNTGHSFLYQGHTHPVNAVSSHFTMFSVASVDEGGACMSGHTLPGLLGRESRSSIKPILPTLSKL